VFHSIPSYICAITHTCVYISLSGVSLCVFACVFACVRACVRTCVFVCTYELSHLFQKVGAVSVRNLHDYLCKYIYTYIIIVCV